MSRSLRAILLVLIPLIYIGSIVSFAPHAISLMENMSAVTSTLLIGLVVLLTWGAYKVFVTIKNS